MRPLRKRYDRVYNPKTKLEETWVTLMVETPSGRFHSIWAGKDESLFPGSAAGRAWAAGEPLPLPSTTSPKGKGRRKAISRG